MSQPIHGKPALTSKAYPDADDGWYDVTYDTPRRPEPPVRMSATERPASWAESIVEETKPKEPTTPALVAAVQALEDFIKMPTAAIKPTDIAVAAEAMLMQLVKLQKNITTAMDTLDNLQQVLSIDSDRVRQLTTAAMRFAAQ